MNFTKNYTLLPFLHPTPCLPASPTMPSYLTSAAVGFCCNATRQLVYYKTYSSKIYRYTRKHHYSLTSQGTCTVFSRLCALCSLDAVARQNNSAQKYIKHVSFLTRIQKNLLMPALRFPFPKIRGKSCLYAAPLWAPNLRWFSDCDAVWCYS